MPGRVPVLALAGPTGSGKSTVAGWLAGRGAAIVDADRVGHEVLRVPEVRTEIVARFGEAVLDDSGEVDRQALGRLVFPDASALRDLEGISHPRLVAELARRIETLRDSRVPTMVVVDAALWLQWPDRPEVDLVLGIDAPLDVRMARIRERDGLDEVGARHRIERQRSIESSLHGADAVLDTADPPAKVRRSLLEILDERLDLGLVATDPA